MIVNPEIKNDITFFDYTYFQIDNLELFLILLKRF